MCQRQGVCVRVPSEQTENFARGSSNYIKILIYILFYYTYLYLKAGGHRGPRGVGDQRRHLPGTRENVPAGLWWRTWAHISRSWWSP